MDTLRWGVVSTARIAREKVIPALHEAPSSEVVAIGSRDLDTARRVASELAIPTAHGSYEAVLADDDVDAVYVPLPNHLHAEWVTRAAEAGKHVLCEKPLAMSAEQAEAMVAACAEAGVALMEAFMYRHHPVWDRLVEIVAGGRLGALRSVHSTFSYYNDDPGNIRNIAEAGGGALMDIGCYCLNASRLVLGSEPTAARSVIVADPALGVDTTTSAALAFGEATATFTVSSRAKADQHLEVHGTEGRLAVARPFVISAERPTRILLHRGKALPGEAEGEVESFAPQSPYTTMVERFAAAVLSGSEVPTPPADGVATMRAIEAVRAGAASA